MLKSLMATAMIFVKSNKQPERTTPVSAVIGLNQAAGARFGEVSGVIHFYYHAAPAGGRSGKLFLKQSGGLSSELLPACGRRRHGACRG